MKRLCLLLGMVCLFAQPLLADGLEQRVRQAALTTYVHGMTQEIADREVGAEGVPYLLELLEDPEFPRRDNVVAFLAYLGYDSEAQALADLLHAPRAAEERSEDLRARLIVPEALGRIAARGGTVAADILRQIEADGELVESNDLSSRLRHGLALASGGVSDDPVADDDPPPLAPTSDDTSSYISLHELSYVNHIDTSNKMTTTLADNLMWEITKLMSFDHGGGDVGCCIQIERMGNGGGFGDHGDGLDQIDNSSELSQVMNVSTGRVKVVNYIGYCGGPGTNIIGCALTPGNTMVVVRLTNNSPDEGRLWGHEYGHNTGLSHNPTQGFIMFASLTGFDNKLTSFECIRYHYPTPACNAVQTDYGDCHDNDNDNMMTSADNCPDDWNYDQADGDADGHGNVCDNCETDPNPGQEDCDGDDIGDVCDPENTVPDEVESIWFTSKTRLTWTSSNFTKHIYRGSFHEAPWDYNHVLVQTVTFGGAWSDGTTPDPGWLNYYLVTQSNACGESE